jgi:hypothetical protein
MADRFYMTLVIGGDPGEHRDRLEAMIAEACVENRIEDEFLELNSDDLRFDDLDELATFCRQINLPYQLRCDAKYEYDGSLRWWSPGMDSEREGYCLQGGQRAFSSENLYAAVASGISLVEFLEMNMPPEIPAFVHAQSIST